MINSGLEFTFIREGENYNVQDVFSFSPLGKSKESLNLALTNTYFEFPFFNLVQNTPFKVTLYNEKPTSIGMREFYLREISKTWITLARIYDAMVSKGFTIPDRISYTPYFVPNIYYINKCYESYLFFENYVGSDGQVVTNKADYLIFFPLIFTHISNGYISINPMYMFKDLSDTLSPFYYDHDKHYEVFLLTKSNFSPDSAPEFLGLPVFELSKGKNIPNIIPDKFNLDRW